MQIPAAPTSIPEGIPPAPRTEHGFVEEPDKPQVIANKARRLNYLAGGSLEDQSQYYNLIQSGKEKFLRTQMALQKDAEDRQRRISLAQAASQGTSETSRELGRGLIEAEMKAQPRDAFTIFEEEIAHKMTNELLVGNRALQKTMDQDPEAVMTGADTIEGALAYKQVTQGLAEKALADAQEQTWAEWGWNVLGSAVPFLQFGRMEDAAQDEKLIFEEFFGRGNLKMSSAEALRRMPIKEAKEKAWRIYERLKKLNQETATEWAVSMDRYTSSELYIDNIFTGLEALDAVGIGAAVRSMMRSGLRAGATNATNVAQAAGNNQISAQGEVGEQIIQKIGGKVRDRLAADPDFVNAVPAFLAPGRILSRGTQTNQGAIHATLDTVQKMQNRLLAPDGSDVVPMRNTQEAILRAYANGIEEQLRRFSPNYESIDSFELETADMNPERLNYVHMLLGNQRTREGFATEEFVKNTVIPGIVRRNKNYSENMMEPIELNGSWYVDIKRPLREDTDDVFAAFGRDESAQTDYGAADLMVRALRNPDAFASQFQRENRKLFVHMPNEVVAAVRDIADNIKNISGGTVSGKQKAKDFSRLINSQLRTQKFSDTQRHFEQEYLSKFNRIPDPDESLAYWSYITLNNYDYYTRNLHTLRAKAIRGVENHRWNIIGNNGELIMDRPLEGIIHREVPDLAKSDVVVFEHGNHTHARPGQLSRERAQELMNDGYELIELAQPDTIPLRKLIPVNDRVEFVLVKNGTEKKALGYRQFDPKEGGHWQYYGQQFLQQAKSFISNTGRAYMDGVNTHSVGISKAEMQGWAEIMERARLALKGGDEAAFRDIISREMGENADDFLMNYIGDPTTYTDPIWDINNPWKVVGHRESVAELTGEEHFRSLYGDKWQSPSDYQFNAMGEVDKKFLGERNAQLREYGVDRNGDLADITDWNQARKLSAEDSIQAAIDNVQRNVSVNDMKYGEVRSWLVRYKDYIDASPNEIRQNPVEVFHNATINVNKNPAIAGRALAERKAVEGLLGTQSMFQRQVEWAKDKLIDQVHRSAGKKWAGRVSDSELIKTRDPLKFLRGYAFHSKLGLFNPVQLFLQAQTLAHAGLITGDWGNTIDSLKFYHFYNMRRLNANVNLDEWANKVGGWTSDELNEVWTFMRQTGLDKIEGESQFQMLHGDERVYRGAVASFLDKGTFFFREGERLNRIPAFAMAYKTWRKANPNAPLDNKAKRWIVERQDILTNRMTRKSAASVQQGWTSGMTQFWSYQMRMTESFLGKDLSWAEKRRLFAGYGLMYGIPGALGAVGLAHQAASGVVENTVGDTPVTSTDYYGDMLQVAIEKGWYEPGEANLAIGFLLGGIYDTLPKLFGKDTTAAERFSPSGLQLFDDLANPDRAPGVADLLLGAGGSIARETAETAMPFMKYIYKVMSDDATDLDYGRAWSESLSFLSNISTVNNTRLFMQVMATGEYKSKRGNVLEQDLDAGYGPLMGLLGIQPKSFNDQMTVAEIQKGRKEDLKNIMKEYMKSQRGWLGAIKAGDEDRTKAYAKEMRDLHDFTFANFGAFEAQRLMKMGIVNEGRSYADIVRDKELTHKMRTNQ